MKRPKTILKCKHQGAGLYLFLKKVTLHLVSIGEKKKFHSAQTNYHPFGKRLTKLLWQGKGLIYTESKKKGKKCHIDTNIM